MWELAARWPVRYVTGLWLLLGACASNDGFGPFPVDAGHAVEVVPPAPPVTIDQLTGGFALVMGDESGTPSRLSGTIRGGKAPGEPLWILSRKPGGCLLNMVRPTCSPACTGAKVCSEQLECIYGARATDVGTIHITGVGAPELTMSASDGKYLLGDELSYPPCTAGDTVELAADGNTFAPFTLSGECVEPVIFDAEIKAKRRKPLALTWTEGSSNGVRIRIQLALGGGTNAPIRIVCDVDDTGETEIDAGLIEQLIKLGVTGTPSITMTRLSAGGTADGEPRQVFLSIQHSVVRTFEIPGVTCANDTDCPPSQICHAGTYCKTK